MGNKSAVFPLQLLGFDVDPINRYGLHLLAGRGGQYPTPTANVGVWWCSVQFSNHTGYKSFTGEVLQGEQLLKLVAVSAPSLTHCTEALISVRALTAIHLAGCCWCRAWSRTVC